MATRIIDVSYVKGGLAAIAVVRRHLEGFVFKVANEYDLQKQVLSALASSTTIQVEGSEVIAPFHIQEEEPPRLRHMPAPPRGRFDIVVVTLGARVVLELKVAGSAPAVERQAQRYALASGVDAVAIVTTSSRLARQVSASPGHGIDDTLGGKAFGAIHLRSCF